jgi:hypothetical protein
MTDRSTTTDDDGSQDIPAEGFRRREFVALGAGVSATMLAGCAGDGSLSPSDSSDGSDDSGGSDGSDGSGSSQLLTGSFRLLISDAPADIADFDRLDVTLSAAHLFVVQGEDEEEDDEEEEETDAEADDDDDSDRGGNETETDTEPANGTAESAETESGEDDEDDEEDGDTDEEDEGGSDRGFAVVDLDGATVDLTRVIDEDAMAVFDSEIAAGGYEKVELSVSTVEGIVDGETVDVKLPSEKLQITNGFEITADEPVSFVFDINVVKRGQKNGYILKPVISGSGVAGRDVDVNEIDSDNEDDDDEQEADDDSEDGSGPESETDDGGADGNESAAAQNGTATGSGD